MLACNIKKSRKFQTLKEQSGLSEFELSVQVDEFIQAVGRFPNLDELDGANSENYIKDKFNIKKNGYTKTSKILEETNSNNIEEAVIEMNNTYRDKEIEIVEIRDTSKVYITQRPSTQEVKVGDSFTGEKVNNMAFWSSVIEKLQDLYGINIIPITNAELNSEEWKEIVGVDSVKSFIYNGNIYLNTDIATVDSPIHEMLHILFGSIKYSNRALYEQLVSLAEQFDTYQEIMESYPNRTNMDLNEEVFVTELSKFLTGQKSALDSLPDNFKYEIFYNVNRTLDTILMGDASVNCVPKEDLYQINLQTLAKMVNSASMNNNYLGQLNDATLNRIMANVKQELMKKGELREDCL